MVTCKLDVAMGRGLMSCGRWDLINFIVMVGLIKDGMVHIFCSIIKIHCLREVVKIERGRPFRLLMLHM
jgi:hypothetical protein